MGLLSHSFISLLVLLGAAPLATSRSLKHTFIPRQASPGFAGCTYPAGWESCNSKDNRNCWVKDPSGKEYNTDTDYEDEFPQGIERTYDLEIQEANISPDGVTKLAQTINGKYPGELIEACWGDTLIINVKNTLPTNGTTIHWHGLRMFQENQMDGVNGVTQCPISEGDTFTYKFHLRQYGHTWYHSHYSSQYTDGVAAPLLIHGPNTDDWDEEWSPIIVTDWYHENAYQAAHAALSRPPPADSILVNGTGRNNPAGTGDYFRQTFEHDKRYLIRLINGGTDFHFHFSIDNHMLEVVSADLVPIKPFYTNSLSIGIGQRYSVIVHANQTAAINGQYWMRTEYVSNGNTCQFDQPNFPVAEPDTQRVGIISYSNSTGGDPTTSRWPATVTCDDTSFEPRVKWQVTAPQNTGNVKAHDAGLDLTAKAHGFNHWTLAERPLWLNYSDPTMLNLDNKTWNPEYDIDPYTQNDPDGFVYMVINSGNGTNSLISAAHPIHLHGHDFAILSQGDGLVDPDNLPTLNVNNPPRRDVAMLPNQGHLILAFKPDNPGIWIMHCHIAWHAGSGLALQVLERQSEIAQTVGSGAIDNVKQGCKKWTDWMATHPQDFSYDMQEDSGI